LGVPFSVPPVTVTKAGVEAEALPTSPIVEVYALKPSGLLFVGKAENVSVMSSLFRLCDRGANVYTKIGRFHQQPSSVP